MKRIRWVLLAVALLVFVSAGIAVLTAPGRVVTRTLSTDNIITSYEWFYDVNAQFVARKGQLKSHSALLAGVGDAERSRLLIELAAIRQSCRDLATRYNANSEKVNKAIFKSHGLPEELPIADCED